MIFKLLKRALVELNSLKGQKLKMKAKVNPIIVHRYEQTAKVIHRGERLDSQKKEIVMIT